MSVNLRITVPETPTSVSSSSLSSPTAFDSAFLFEERVEPLTLLEWKDLVETALKQGLPYYAVAIPFQAVSPDRFQFYDGVALVKEYAKFEKDPLLIHFFMIKLFDINSKGIKQSLDIARQAFIPIEELFPDHAKNRQFIINCLNALDCGQIKREEEQKKIVEEKSEEKTEKVDRAEPSNISQTKNLENRIKFALSCNSEKTLPKETLKWLLSVEHLDSAEVLFELGCSYKEGKGCSIGFKRAFKYYTRAAKKGYTKAECNLGVLLADGLGCKMDPKAAFSNYLAAALKGDAEALRNLGMCYQNGIGCIRNPYKAFQYFQESAAKGHRLAHKDLSICYQNGSGCVKSPEDALLEYILAAPSAFFNALEDDSRFRCD